MDKVINTIKESCDDLKQKDIINYTQHKECKDLIQKQNWREELKNERYKKQVDKIEKEEIKIYTKYEKLINKTYEQILNNYKLSLSNNNVIYTNNVQKYLANLDNYNKELKSIIEKYQKPIKNKESFHIFRELVAKKELNKNYKKKIKQQKKDIDFMIEKNKKLEDKSINNKKRYNTLLVVLIILILLNIVIIILYIKPKLFLIV